MAGSLDRYHKAPLMLRAYPCRSARQDFTALRYISPEFYGVFIINILRLINAKLADLSAFARVLPVISIVRQNFHLLSQSCTAFRFYWALKRKLPVVHVKLRKIGTLDRC